MVYLYKKKNAKCIYLYMYWVYFMYTVYVCVLCMVNEQSIKSRLTILYVNQVVSTKRRIYILLFFIFFFFNGFWSTGWSYQCIGHPCSSHHYKLFSFFIKILILKKLKVQSWFFLIKPD